MLLCTRVASCFIDIFEGVKLARLASGGGSQGRTLQDGALLLGDLLEGALEGGGAGGLPEGARSAGSRKRTIASASWQQQQISSPLPAQVTSCA